MATTTKEMLLEHLGQPIRRAALGDWLAELYQLREGFIEGISNATLADFALVSAFSLREARKTEDYLNALEARLQGKKGEEIVFALSIRNGLAPASTARNIILASYTRYTLGVLKDERLRPVMDPILPRLAVPTIGFVSLDPRFRPSKTNFSAGMPTIGIGEKYAIGKEIREGKICSKRRLKQLTAAYY